MKKLRLAMLITATATMVVIMGLLAGLALHKDRAPGVDALTSASVLAKPTPAPLPTKPRVASSAGLALHGAPPRRNPHTSASKPEWQENGNDSIYTWQDGDRTMRVLLQPDLAVQGAANKEPTDTVLKTRAGESIVRKRDKSDVSGLPVFRSESGNTLMTLPGGVLLVLDPGWDQHAIDQFFSDNQVDHSSVTELDFLDNAFLVPTEPGFPSLELANRLVGIPGVVSSSPNWRRDLSRD